MQSLGGRDKVSLVLETWITSIETADGRMRTASLFEKLVKRHRGTAMRQKPETRPTEVEGVQAGSHMPKDRTATFPPPGHRLPVATPVWYASIQSVTCLRHHSE